MHSDNRLNGANLFTNFDSCWFERVGAMGFGYHGTDSGNVHSKGYFKRFFHALQLCNVKRVGI